MAEEPVVVEEIQEVAEEPVVVEEVQEVAEEPAVVEEVQEVTEEPTVVEEPVEENTTSSIDDLLSKLSKLQSNQEEKPKAKRGRKKATENDSDN